MLTQVNSTALSPTEPAEGPARAWGVARGHRQLCDGVTFASLCR